MRMLPLIHTRADEDIGALDISCKYNTDAIFVIPYEWETDESQIHW